MATAKYANLVFPVLHFPHLKTVITVNFACRMQFPPFTRIWSVFAIIVSM